MTAQKVESNKETKNSKALKLIDAFELFHDENRKCFITIKGESHSFTLDIQGILFRDWLQQQYFKTYIDYLNSKTLADVIDAINSRAKFSGMQYSVFLRAYSKENTVYLDIGDQTYRGIKITEHGWELIENLPVKFVRCSSMQALPLPIPNEGNIDLLWQHINIPENQQILVLAWLLECWCTSTAFPILFLTGQQGSAKSTTQEFLKRLIDPSSSNLRGMPRKPDDLMIGAANNFLLSFNNLSQLDKNRQDDFCCISTGGSYATRKLYSDGREIVFNIKRPVVMNGIAEVITAPDLLERSIIIQLPEISTEHRRLESEIIKQFESDYPYIFTGLLDLLTKVLKILPTINLERNPRMADFAKLGAAVAIAIDQPENSFIEAFTKNQDEGEAMSIESSPIVLALIQFMTREKKWEGTYQMLFDHLSAHYKITRHGWPLSPKGVSEAFKRHASYLSKIGITIQKVKRTNAGYWVMITMKNKGE